VSETSKPPTPASIAATHLDGDPERSATRFVAARLQTPDQRLRSSGACWAYTDYDGGFRIAAVPQDDAPRLVAELRRAGMLFMPDHDAQVYPRLAWAVHSAEPCAWPYEPQARVD
jgi:hypothetical protein